VAGRQLPYQENWRLLPARSGLARGGTDRLRGPAGQAPLGCVSFGRFRPGRRGPAASGGRAGRPALRAGQYVFAVPAGIGTGRAAVGQHKAGGVGGAAQGTADGLRPARRPAGRGPALRRPAHRKARGVCVRSADAAVADETCAIMGPPRGLSAARPEPGEAGGGRDVEAGHTGNGATCVAGLAPFPGSRSSNTVVKVGTLAGRASSEGGRRAGQPGD
jgi:hypothetical protein